MLYLGEKVESTFSHGQGRITWLIQCGTPTSSVKNGRILKVA